MRLSTRRLLNRALTGLGLGATALVALALGVILGPIVVRGVGAFVFRGTVEWRALMLEEFGRGDRAAIEAELARARQAREPVWAMLAAFAEELEASPEMRRKYRRPLRDLERRVEVLLGPRPGDRRPPLLHDRFGQTRWDRAQVKLHDLLWVEEWARTDPSSAARRVLTPRAEVFAGTSLAPLFPLIEREIEAMLLPRWTVYVRFLTDTPRDSHFFGGIWPELLGTFYLTIGAVLFAVPIGVLSAMYLTEYARGGWMVGALRMCVNTLAGVPSIVFGLFGLAFFIKTLGVSSSKSVLAGALTLATLILPLVIRASEEALRAVPGTFREAALSLGASRWRSTVGVVLPAALPGILTGIVIAMGRAAGETAPIIFTAAVSVGLPLLPWQTLTQPTPALPWNIYNLATEHAAVDEIRHVQYGMVLTLVGLVLLLNATAIVLRARIAKRLRG